MKNILQKAYLKIFGIKKSWSIGVLTIKKSEAFEPQKHLPMKPTIDTKNITDCEAAFVADPFLIKDKDKIYCFFEIMDKQKNKGIIGLSSSTDGINFKYEKVVLEESFHLSYPAVYYVNGSYYIIPESGENNDVRLYKAKNFPYKWEFEKILLRGKNWADSTLIFHENKWYMFVSENTHKSLYIYYSDRFDGEYVSHPMNPIYADNLNIARPGGMILNHENKLYRFGQDCSKRYGEKVQLLEIKILSPNEYKEKFLKSLLTPAKKIIWNGKRMHHSCYLDMDKYYLVATDGIGYKFFLN